MRYACNSYLCRSVIRPYDFLDYREQIKQIFPSEDPDIYYRPSILEDRTNSNRIYVPAGGRLYERYKNVLKKHRQLEKLSKENTSEVDIETSEYEAEQSLQWLNNNKEPWDEVTFH